MAGQDRFASPAVPEPEEAREGHYSALGECRHSGEMSDGRHVWCDLCGTYLRNAPAAPVVAEAMDTSTFDQLQELAGLVRGRSGKA